MGESRQTIELQNVLTDERARLIRFLIARGAGDRAETLYMELCKRVVTSPDPPTPDPLWHVFRVAENMMRELRLARIDGAEHIKRD